MASELDALAARMLASKDFFPAPVRTALFNYLWANRDRVSPAIDIWEGALHEISRSKKKNEAEYDYETVVRQSCDDLREAFRSYFASVTRGWYFDLPPAKRGVGYRLNIFRLYDPPIATMTFWGPHVEQKNVVLVFAQPMCYLDIESGCYLRFLNTNSQSGVRDEALSELEKRHPEELQKWFGTAARERLRPAHIFVGIGEMAALDALTTWFQTYPFVTVQKVANESITTLRGISPILIGSPRTNKFIRTFLNSEEGHHFRYRHHETIGYIAIKDAGPEEKAALSEFSLYEENGSTVVSVRPMSLSAVRTRLVVLTRMPKPGGPGSVTMISSDTSLAIEQVALALTIDEGQQTEKKPQIGQILKSLGWPHHPLPASFEVLFSVKIAPGGLDDEAEAPRLLMASKY